MAPVDITPFRPRRFRRCRSRRQPGWSDMPKVTLTPCKSTNPPELKSARRAQSTPNLDVRLTRTQSGNILDIDFEFGAHGAGATCGCLCVVLP